MRSAPTASAAARPPTRSWRRASSCAARRSARARRAHRRSIGCRRATSPQPLRLGLAAVIEASDGTRSYWALRHPAGQPDFHHADAFALTAGGARRWSGRRRPPCSSASTACSPSPRCARPLAGRRVGLLAHPASVTRDARPLARCARRARRAARSPRRSARSTGLRGDKQDNMVESPDFVDPQHGIPVFSLYGEVRRPTAAMLDQLRRAAGRPAGRRHAASTPSSRRCATCSKQPPRTARPCGCSIGRTRSAARSRGCGCVPAGRASSAPARCRCATA